MGIFLHNVLIIENFLLMLLLSILLLLLKKKKKKGKEDSHIAIELGEKYGRASAPLEFPSALLQIKHNRNKNWAFTMHRKLEKVSLATRLPTLYVPDDSLEILRHT